MFSASIPNEVFLLKEKQKNVHKRINLNKWKSLPLQNKFQFNFNIKLTEEEIKQKLYKTVVNFTSSNNTDIVNFKNTPFKLKLIGYKDNDIIVSTQDEKYCFLMGIDVCINTILSDGTDKDGILFGEYIFVKFKKIITPIKLNSEIYKAVIDYINNKTKSSFSIKDMSVGKVYYSTSGNTALLLGFVDTLYSTVKIPKDENKHFWLTKAFSTAQPVIDFSIKYKNCGLSYLWLKLPNISNRKFSYEEVQDELNNSIKNKNYYKFHITKNHKHNNTLFNEKIVIPDNIISLIRKMTEQSIINSVDNFRNYRFNPNTRSTNQKDEIRHYDAVFVSEYSKILNMVPFGADLIKSTVFDLFKQWEK